MLFQLTTWDECDLQGDLKIPVHWEVWAHQCQVTKHIYFAAIAFNTGLYDESEYYQPLHVNVTLPNPVPWSPCPPQLTYIFQQTWANIDVRSFFVPGMVRPIESPWEKCSVSYLDGAQLPWTLLPSSGMSCYLITAQDSSQRSCDPHCSWLSFT